MKKLAPVYLLLLLILIPAKVWCGEDCDRIGKQMEAVSEKMQQLAAQYTDKDGNVRVGSKEEAEAMGAKFKALSSQANGLSQEYAKCIGMPTNEAGNYSA